jgi:polypeptide N-acetylgalactosaminyltransferase
VNPGDISKQLKIRKDLNCKPFKWFMEKVAFDLPKFYPPVIPPPYAQGEVNLQNYKTFISLSWL